MKDGNCFIIVEGRGVGGVEYEGCKRCVSLVGVGVDFSSDVFSASAKNFKAGVNTGKINYRVKEYEETARVDVTRNDVLEEIGARF